MKTYVLFSILSVLLFYGCSSSEEKPACPEGERYSRRAEACVKMGYRRAPAPVNVPAMAPVAP